jgi:quinol monooxygenase YgiN
MSINRRDFSNLALSAAAIAPLLAATGCTSSNMKAGPASAPADEVIHVMARLVFKPEFATQARDILAKVVVASRQETGCRLYQLYQQADAPHVFQTVEQWTDQAAADGHMKTPHIGAAIAAAAQMFAAPPEIVQFNKVL